MNDNERSLIRAVADRKWDYATTYAKIILNGITSEKDRVFKEKCLSIIEENQEKPFQLPYDVQDLLAAQDSSVFQEDRFLLREDEKKVVDKLILALTASSKLKSLGIRYVPSLLLTGVPGTGKTLLAKYIAHKTGLPFVYVRFSNLVGSYLGQTQSNIARVFKFVRENSAVVCFDEIDAIGLARGQKNDHGEMSRVVIALMQELDTIENGTIIIGTTNRKDMLDAALLRRFNFNHEVELLSYEDAEELSNKFFASVGFPQFGYVPDKPLEKSKISAADVIKRCTDVLVEFISAGKDFTVGGVDGE